MQTRREAVEEMFKAYLWQWFGELPESAYEHASNLAECAFYALGVAEEERGGPPDAWMPRRLPVLLIHGKRYFLDMRLRQYRNVKNPHDAINF